MYNYINMMPNARRAVAPSDEGESRLGKYLNQRKEQLDSEMFNQTLVRTTESLLPLFNSQGKQPLSSTAKLAHKVKPDTQN